MQWEEPLFHIHLNVDFPFNLTGILYFPKLSPNLQIQKDRIQLFQNQVFVTDNVEGIVPEFLTMLRGVIDSPDIPLNVSRSYLQADGNVKKISEYITKKVAEKLQSLFKDQREDFEKKWNDIKIVIEYGMLSEAKFYEKAVDFALYPDTDGKYHLLKEVVEQIKPNQTDKTNKTIVLYTSDLSAQHSYIASAKERGYLVLHLDSPIVAHLIQKLESENENIQFARVDADTLDQLVQKDENQISKLSDKEKETLKGLFEEVVPKENFSVQLQPMASDAQPIWITQPEFMRRMKDMQATGGGGFMAMGGFPEMYNLVVNENHPLATKIMESKDKELIKHAFDLARLSQNLLKGEALTQFIQNSYNKM
jgi:molecular chaperone HtpG